MKILRGLTGTLSVSALALGLSGTAYAASGTPAVYYNATYSASMAHGASSGYGPFAPASSINITNSRHNLSSTNTLGTNHTPAVLGTADTDGNRPVIGTNQICVFCHTPHGFNSTQSGPLWNKTLSSSTTYAIYTGGTFVGTPSPGSVSLACLSCHDGTQALDNMVNAPGSGGMSSVSGSAASGVANSTTGQSQGYTWASFGQMNQDGTATPDANGLAVIGTNVVAATANPNSSGLNLGTDLSNDHPVSVQYCGGGISTTTSAASAINGMVAEGACLDRLFNLPTVQYLGGGLRFWVDTNVMIDSVALAAGAASVGGSSAYPIMRDPATYEIYVNDSNTAASGVAGDSSGRGFIASTTTDPASKFPGWGVRTKQDLMLFNNTGVNGPSVECASCHDPHTPNNGTFLRVSNEGSGLCMSCHVK